MIDIMMRDSQVRPDIFCWNGPLLARAVDEWEQEHLLHVPPDLKRLWSLKGGGDLFESETILQPFGAEDYDLVDSVNVVFGGKNLPEYCMFHTGIVESVFRKADGAIFTMGSTGSTHMLQFRDLDDWYVNNLRPVFAARYGLPTLGNPPGGRVAHR